MKKIQLSQGYVALVDDEDFDKISRHSWHADVVKDGSRIYARTSIGLGKGKKKNIRLHRFIMEPKPKEIVDHINGNSSTLDCRRENLRIVNKSKNGHNAKINKRNTSGYKGVSFHPQTHKWQARILINGKRKYFGLFISAELASTKVEKERLIQLG